jgi:hypothetical protein
MKDFANSMQQVDATIDFKYWTPVVRNETKPPSASFADNNNNNMNNNEKYIDEMLECLGKCSFKTG